MAVHFEETKCVCICEWAGEKGVTHCPAADCSSSVDCRTSPAPWDPNLWALLIKNHGLGSWDAGGGHNRLCTKCSKGGVWIRPQLISICKKICTWCRRQCWEKKMSWHVPKMDKAKTSTGSCVTSVRKCSHTAEFLLVHMQEFAYFHFIWDIFLKCDWNSMVAVKANRCFAVMSTNTIIPLCYNALLIIQHLTPNQSKAQVPDSCSLPPTQFRLELKGRCEIHDGMITMSTDITASQY